MTPNDRAADILDSMGNEVSMPHLWAIKIKKAITAAVEEEREAIAQMVEDERSYAYAGNLAKRIRARSQAK